MRRQKEFASLILRFPNYNGLNVMADNRNVNTNNRWHFAQNVVSLVYKIVKNSASKSWFAQGERYEYWPRAYPDNFISVGG